MGPPPPTAMSDLHDYIHNVLETGDHGPYRIIEFDIPTLNNIIERHAKKIGENLFGSCWLRNLRWRSPLQLSISTPT